jgi:hypothetical protein
MKEPEKAIRAPGKEMLARAEATDAEQDARYGKDQRGEDWPEERQRRQTRWSLTSS